jgi:hypothetical protein
MSLADNIIKALGIDPAQLQAGLTSLITDAATVRTEVLGARKGFKDAMEHFQERVSQLEKSNARIEKDVAEIHRLLLLVSPPQQINGAAYHDREQ